MTHTLIARFAVTVWEPAALPGVEDDWAAAVTMRKTYTAGLVGSSVAHFVSSGDEEHGRGYLAAERVTGELEDGRSGSFTVHHGGLAAPGAQSAFAYLVPGAGSGDFTGFSGSGRIEHDDEGPFFVVEIEG